MKIGFSILRDRPKITITVTRDSVCAADDVMAPNLKEIVVHSFTEPEDFISAVVSGYDMPQIQGSRAVWEVLLNEQKIGIVAQEWSSPKPTVKQIRLAEHNRVHLRYLAQVDPNSLV